MDIKTLRYWHKLEHFYPYTLQEQHSNNIKTWLVNGPNQFVNFQQPKIKPEMVVRYYTVYFGIFKIDDALRALEEGFGEHMRFRDTGDDVSCFCTFSLDARGVFNPDSFRVSSFPWAIHRVRDGNIVMDEWDDAFHSFTADMFLYLKNFGEPITYEFLLETRNNFAGMLNWKVKFVDAWLRIDMATGKKQKPQETETILENALEDTLEQEEPDTLAEDEETDAQIKQNDLLNSFYVRDLERIIKSLEKDQSACGESFRRFLEHNIENKVDIEHNPDVLLELMAPRNLPKGRWPSEYGLRFMQQVDVNAFLTDKLYEQPLFSVNGPPGTGKTTLLKDIIAAIIVNRAIVMCTLSLPDDAFTEEVCSITTPTGNGIFTNHVFELKQEIRRYGILVASNNNGAVENITHNLPSIEEIPTNYIKDEYSYFAEVTDLRFGKGKTWAMNAAALGNRKNCSRFVECFWPLKKDSGEMFDLNKVLRECTKTVSKKAWEQAKERFKAVLEDLNKEYGHIEEAYKNVLKISSIMAELHGTNQKINRINEAVQDKTKAARAQKQDLENYRQEIERCRILKKEMWRNDPLLPVKSWFWQSKECNEYRELKKKIKSSKMEILSQTERIAKTVQDKQRLNEELNDLNQKLSCLEKVLTSEQGILEQFRIKTISPFRIDEYFCGSQNEALNKFSPWGYDELNRLREKVFLEALQLHKIFAENSKKLRDNLDAFAKFLRRQIPAATVKVAAPALLQSFFLIVPVVSTTFASIGSFLKDIPANDIGYLFIDEAGQAMPQSAAGAIWRANKVIAVGDPLQIEPVVTLHDNVIDVLGRYYEQDRVITDKFSSVQSLSDLANRLGGYRTLEEPDDLWVGAPLIVHSRCQRQVFNISNEIAYNNKMIYDSKSHDAVCTWLNVYGNSLNGHYVPEQINKILPIILDCFSKFTVNTDSSYRKYPSLFIITPFRSVKAGIVTYFRNNLPIVLGNENINVDSSVIRNWINNCIGTIHTFQGKEADTVILCLGIDSGGKGEGAVRWACQRPNILNVAVTRSKGDLYFVGDRSIWENKDYFKTAIKYCS